MFKRIGQEFQCFKGYGENSNVSKDKVEIPTIKKHKERNPMFQRKRQDFQCLKG